MTPFRRLASALVAVAPLMLVAASSARASTILFDSPTVCPPPDYCSPPYPTTNGLPTVVPDGLPSAFWGGGYFSDFSLAAGALVTTVSWVDVEGGGPTGLAIYADDGTAFDTTPPGSVLATYSFGASDLTASLLGYAWPDVGNRVFRYTVALPGGFAAAGSTRYWLTISDGGGWARNGGGLGYSSIDGGQLTSVGGGRGVFTIEGTPFHPSQEPPSPTVPEPASLLLLATGLSATLVRRWRR